MSKARLRISVKFGETKLLVPCGDGAITVDELIEKAIGRYKKHKKMHEEDEVVPEGLFQEDGNACYGEDSVIDLLDDKEMVTLVYKVIPHDAGPDYEPILIGGHLLDPQPSSPTPPPGVREEPVIVTGPPPAGPPPVAPPVVPPAGPPLVVPPVASSGASTQTNQVINQSTHASHSLSSSHLTIDDTGGSYLPPSPFSPNSNNFKSGSIYSPTDDRSFLTTPTNRFSSHENLLSDAESAEPTVARVTGDYIPRDGVVTNGGGGNGILPDTNESALSQVNMEMVNDFPDHPDSQIGIPSQISFHSDDMHKFNSSTTPPNYDLDPVAPVSGDSGFYSNQPRTLPHSSDPNKSNLANTQPSLNQPQFEMPYHQRQSSQSMDRLDMLHKSDSNMYPFGMGGLGGGMSQDHPAVQSQQDLYYPSDMGMGGPGGYMMIQPEGGSGWPNSRMYMHPMMYAGGRGGGAYHMPPHRHNQYMGGRGLDHYNHYPDEGYPPLPPHMQLMDRRNKRSSIGSVPPEYDDHMTGGRGRYPPPRGWGKSGYDDDYLMIRRDDDHLDYPHLSQPAAYPTSRYSMITPPTAPPLHMSRISGPSGHSLSQPGMGGVYRKKGIIKNRNEQSPRSDIRMKPDDTTTFSIDEELSEEDTFDDAKPSPFLQRSTRKSMNLDCRYGEIEKLLENIDIPSDSQVPQYGSDDDGQDNDDNDIKDENNDMNDLGNVHIVELLRGEEPLGIQLVGYTNEERDVGVFIGALDEDGFAAKSGGLKIHDQILACNGEDFTQETNEKVEERFREMAEREPLLRIAISRGFGFKQNEGNSQENAVSAESTTCNNNPSGETASPSNAVSATLTNTRQLGVKHVIIITRSSKNGTFGFGLSSRDVFTNEEDHPIYIKSITSNGPAFQDGRLKLGDRLLEVNDTSVKGLSQADVVKLLRSSGSSVKLVLSRQELVESHDESTDSTETSLVSITNNKTVLVFDIHLDNGLAGLGVTVHGRCSSKREHSDMGIYIKSIVPGGAAARDGRLKVNDQLLSVNKQSVINMSNRDAMESLKRELKQAEPNKISSIRLTIGRSGGNRKHTPGASGYMPALEEEERPPPDGGQTNEIGIDCPDDVKVNPVLSQELDLGAESFENQAPPVLHDDLMLSRSSNGSLGSGTGVRMDSSLELSGNYYQPMNTAGVTTAGNYEGGVAGGGARGTEYVSDTRTGSSQIKKTMSGTVGGARGHSYSPKNITRQIDYNYREGSLDRSALKKKQPITKNLSGGWLTGGADSADRMRHNSPMRQESLSPTNERSPWLPVSGDHSRYSSSSSSSYPRSASVHSELSASGSFQPHHVSHHVLSFTPHDHSRYSSSGNLSSSQRSSRDNNSSFRRTSSPPYDTLERSVRGGGGGGGGGGGSHKLDHHHHHLESHTLPRMSGGGKYTINEYDPSVEFADQTSLASYSSDNELANPFQRDDAARRSIPKNKNVPQPNLKHVPLANVVPLMEGEGSPSPPLRAGSDSDLPGAFAHYNHSDMLDGVEVGPNLRMAKSSSLESLQTVLHHSINPDGPRGLRGRGSTRNSFRRAVDRSYEQRGNDTTMISLTKNPKKKSSKSFLKLLRPRKSSKSKKDKRTRSRTMSTAEVELSQENMDNLAKEFGISMDTIRRMQSHSGRLEGDDEAEAAAIERERRRTVAGERRDDTLYASHNSRAL